jgi:CheY-like chemotaxis protein
VLVASSGNAALELARSHDGDIHLLLTDVVMPQMSGKELSAELAGVFRAIPTLYMSGYTDDIIAHHGVLDEGENFLEKPFSPESLLSKIRDVLDATTSRPGAIDEVVRP